MIRISEHAQIFLQVPLLGGWFEESLVQLEEQKVMLVHVGGILRVSLASLIFFILTLAISLYFNEGQGLIKSVIQAVIATLIFGGGMFLFSRNK